MISLVIPVHNEEAILQASLERLLREFSELTRDFEVVVIENGSTDRSFEILETFSRREKCMRPYRAPFADYGKALKMGLSEAAGEKIISEEIDILDHGFHRDALAALDDADIVIASKRHPSARDDRGFYRRLGTDTITALLRWGCGLKASDTHGPKAWRRDVARRIVSASTLDGDLFASEAILRAERNGLRIRELPLSVIEQRSSAIPLLRRVPRVLRDVRRLQKAMGKG